MTWPTNNLHCRPPVAARRRSQRSGGVASRRAARFTTVAGNVDGVRADTIETGASRKDQRSPVPLFFRPRIRYIAGRRPEIVQYWARHHSDAGRRSRSHSRRPVSGGGRPGGALSLGDRRSVPGRINHIKLAARQSEDG
jgi:hypothetical protein